MRNLRISSKSIIDSLYYVYPKRKKLIKRFKAELPKDNFLLPAHFQNSNQI